MMQIEATALEWLDLAQPVQQRARFERRQGDWHASWLAP